MTIGELIELAGQQSRSHPQAGYMARAAVTDLILRAAGLDGNEDRGEIALAIIGAAGRASLGQPDPDCPARSAPGKERA